jgi:CheY-like chemotaxis protein
MTWLIAEDENDIRNLIDMMCQVWGHQTMTFENGQKVWEWLDDLETGRYGGQMPELILMDIRMPGKKGTELAYRMRSMPALHDRPIVLMTAFTLNDSERAQMMSSNGVDHIIHKPLPDFEELHKLLHNIARHRQAS